MSFATLTVVSAVALLGPLLALPRRWHVPVLLGELVAGVLLGPSVAGYLNPGEATFAFLANVGFALVMFVAGSHVPVRDRRLAPSLRVGLGRAAAVGALAAPLGWAAATIFGTGHAALYAVLIASSSAALVLPIVDEERLAGERVLQTVAQVAIADAACVVALPLVIDPSTAGRSAAGAVAVVACSVLLFVALRALERSGLRKRAHRVSEKRGFALEMRINLVLLFALSALAVTTHVSILLAGFCFGLAVAAVGEPRRLAKQLFALTEGFLGPLFFVWLGASLPLAAVGSHPSSVLLGLVLGGFAIAAHLAMRATGQPLALGGLAAAQLGLPVAAVAVGEQTGVLRAEESAAIVIAALVSTAVATACGALAARRRTAMIER
ncbi:cation:proton antiporter [Asanoa iriomotensis]|uniref:Cation/H+ exchanger transmembrane domain-containing protein n=1 Tax=Asanoa iriomotensis TaxID=234613 RepID=A0ABQ4CDX9_9ACTN|nr:cation:proton antiporter [Asanoa iriomotensis]GIF60520.1 hypothetical protein Air01nite_66150 [Asanoa iriomotensis]